MGKILQILQTKLTQTKQSPVQFIVSTLTNSKTIFLMQNIANNKQVIKKKKKQQKKKIKLSRPF